MTNLAYKDDIILSKQPQYTCIIGKEAVSLANKSKNEINYDEVKIIHTVPKMTDIEREKNKKMIGNELYEIFLRIQFRLNSDSETD